MKTKIIIMITICMIVFAGNVDIDEKEFENYGLMMYLIGYYEGYYKHETPTLLKTIDKQDEIMEFMESLTLSNYVRRELKYFLRKIK